MVEGRVQKNLKEQSLLEQKFWKDDSKTVADVIKEAITALGENIKVAAASPCAALVAAACCCCCC